MTVQKRTHRPKLAVPTDSYLNHDTETYSHGIEEEDKSEDIESGQLEDEFLNLILANKAEAVCYDDFEPSGQMHIAQGFMMTINVNKLTSAGYRVKIWIADWLAKFNNKMGGDLKKIETVGHYLIEKAIGMDLEGGKVDFLWSRD